MEEIGIMKKSSVRYTHSRGGMVVILLFLSVFAFLMMVPMIYNDIEKQLSSRKFKFCYPVSCHRSNKHIADSSYYRDQKRIIQIS